MNYWYLCIICLFVMSLFIYAERKENYVAAVLLKGVASSVFVLFGLLSAGDVVASDFTKLIFIGLLLGMIADILLNLRFVFKRIGQKVFILGILVFMAGHVLYILAQASKCVPQWPYLWGAILAGVVLTAITMVFILRAITAKAGLKIFGIFYIGAVMIMTCLSVSACLVDFNWANLVFAIGAVSFLVSDIVLILNTFGKKTRFALRITNLTLYYIGQLLIAFSLQLIK